MGRGVPLYTPPIPSPPKGRRDYGYKIVDLDAPEPWVSPLALKNMLRHYKKVHIHRYRFGMYDVDNQAPDPYFNDLVRTAYIVRLKPQKNILKRLCSKIFSK